MKTIRFIAVLLVLIFSDKVYPQSRPNLDLISRILEHSVTKADSILGKTGIVDLSVTIPQTLEILRPKIIEIFVNHGYTVKGAGGDAGISVEYSLTSARVDYKNAFSDGLFGGTLLEREVTVNSSILAKGSDKTIHPFQFKETISDTVRLNDVAMLESPALPFTQSPIPALPFLSNLWEPIIVTGTLIVTVILLFTVRSK